MTRVIFIEHNGTEHVVEATNGDSVMQTAVSNNVPGIIGDCGGCCSCATCHGYIDPGWLDRLEPKASGESMMLEGVLGAESNSRLTCQIAVQPELDGLTVRLPESQT
jgi:ferredoxin, 2Fe-2S